MSLKSANKIEANVYELEIEIDGAKFKETVQKVFTQKKSTINLPGFRKGKAPLSLIERTYGKDVFYDDAIEMLFPELIEDAYEAGKIDAVDNPYDFEIKEIGDEGVLFTVKVTVKPDIQLLIYKGLQGEKGETEVSQSEIDAEIDKLRDRNSRTIVVEDRAAQDGDMTVIDFEGFVDDVAFEGGKGENHSLTLGSGSFIPGFEEQVIGHAINDEFDVNVTFPEEYAPELAGKEAVFKVKLHEIKVKELPEVDDEFAKDIGEYDTAAEMKKGIEADILKQKIEATDNAFEEQILTALTDHAMADIPEVMITKKAKENTENFSRRLSQQGADLDTYLMYVGSDRETFDAQMLEDARKQVTLRLALEKIGELEGITVTEEDFAAEYQKLADTYSMEVEKIKTIIPEDTLRDDIISENAVKFVIENAVVVAPYAMEESVEDEKTEKAEKAEKKEDDAKKSEKKPAVKKKPAAKKKTETKEKSE
ncbi:MAG: trigger factor [Clostridiales bacterium]|nr:trigger factor [Clostridiales bacterium]